MLNQGADAPSRHRIQTSLDLSLPQDIFNELVKWRGPLQVDLMANATNKKLPLYVSPHPDQDAVDHNALQIDWNKWSQIYIFPPIWLIPLVMQKLEAYRQHGLLILPWAPTEPWFPTILQRSMQHKQLPLQHLVPSGWNASAKWTAFNF